ncbi:GNAT family N-acetyltransferase [Streptomyces hygroscopicus subsp. hygroscopicus]|uniref:GNAT family N-acetyltransferase n=1 Tax=Streptomyces hygroscopicus TaxID=1912 RepID=UPI001C65BD88|nr:GNAT family N-acetyltransferase [Streptomyces hygroscopicus]MBW8090391.1 GNAT family N-acetyltransferase [Streptomyces hygroscopicus subsp. hygroscopicus]
MPRDDLQRVQDFRLSFARRQAAEVREVPGGFLVLDGRYARSHEHNQLHIVGPADPEGLPALADEAMAFLPHRQITVHDQALGPLCVPPFERAGYRHVTEVLMVHTGPVPRAPAADVVERELGPDPHGPLRRAVTAQQRRWMPDADERTTHDLVERRTARLAGADQVLFLAAHDDSGEITSWADLYLEPAAGIAQIEEVVTAEPYLRRGYADAVVSSALRRAAAAGCALRFLVADQDDWPLRWYGGRGFTAIGRTHVFSRF